MTLTEFLTARLDEDEAAARNATPGPWAVGRTMREDGEWEYGSHVAAMGEEKRMLLDMCTGYAASKHAQTAGHIARHDPARVLREVDARRRILELLEVADDSSLGAATLRAVVREFAAVWSRHADYDESWRP